MGHELPLTRLDPTESMWVDVVNPTAEEVEKVAGLVGLEPPVLKSSLAPRGPTRIRLHEATAVVLPLLRLEAWADFPNLLAIVKGNILLTLRDTSFNHIVHNVDDTISARVKLGGDIDHYYLLYRLLDEIVQSNFDVLEALRDSVEELELTSLREAHRNIIPMISAIRKRSSRIRDILTGERHLVDYLREATLPKAPSDLHRRTLSEVWTELSAQLSNVDSLGNALVTTISMRDLEVSTRLTKIITLLTVIATVLLLPNTLATIFGIPSLPLSPESPIAAVGHLQIFPWLVVVAAIVASAVLPLVWLIRKGWMRV